MRAVCIDRERQRERERKETGRKGYEKQYKKIMQERKM